MKKLSLALIAGASLLAGCGGTQNEGQTTESNETSDQTEQTETVEETTTPAEKVGVVGDSIFLYAEGKTMQDMKFRPDELTIESGKAYQLVLINTGEDKAMTHNMVVVEEGTGNEVGQNGLEHKDNGYVMPNDINVIYQSPLVEFGQTNVTPLQIDESGDYDFICSYPGHWGKMNGKIEVE